MRIGVALHHPEDAVKALAEYAQIYPELPDHVGWHAALTQSMPGLPFVPEPLRDKRLLPMKLLDPEFPNGNRYCTKEAHINELPEEALEIPVSRWGEMKMSREIEIMGLGGAMARVSPDATAFANRHHNWWLNFARHWDEAELDASNIAQIRAAHDVLKPGSGEAFMPTS